MASEMRHASVGMVREKIGVQNDGARLSVDDDTLFGGVSIFLGLTIATTIFLLFLIRTLRTVAEKKNEIKKGEASPAQEDKQEDNEKEQKESDPPASPQNTTSATPTPSALTTPLPKKEPTSETGTTVTSEKSAGNNASALNPESASFDYSSADGNYYLSLYNGGAMYNGGYAAGNYYGMGPYDVNAAAYGEYWQYATAQGQSEASPSPGYVDPYYGYYGYTQEQSQQSATRGNDSEKKAQPCETNSSPFVRRLDYKDVEKPSPKGVAEVILASVGQAKETPGSTGKPAAKMSPTDESNSTNTPGKFSNTSEESSGDSHMAVFYRNYVPPLPSAPPARKRQIEPAHATGGKITTLMVRHLPCKLTFDELRLALSQAGFEAGKAYDFLYLPQDLVNQTNRGYCFINLCQESLVEKFKTTFTRFQFHKNSSKLAQVMSGHLQGYQELCEHFAKTVVRKHKNCIYMKGQSPNGPPAAVQ